jgi:hypothetical protein
MTKVYLAIDNSQLPRVLGVFSTRELAWDYARRVAYEPYIRIDEYEIDNPLWRLGNDLKKWLGEGQ